MTLLSSVEDLSLEDSWVLSIEVRPRIINFGMEVVMRGSHPKWRPPNPGDQFFTLRGVLRFEDVDAVNWTMTRIRPAIDATGEIDYGHIDHIAEVTDGLVVEGSFGRLWIRCGALKFIEETETSVS